MSALGQLVDALTDDGCVLRPTADPAVHDLLVYRGAPLDPPVRLHLPETELVAHLAALAPSGVAVFPEAPAAEGAFRLLLVHLDEQLRAEPDGVTEIRLVDGRIVAEREPVSSQSLLRGGRPSVAAVGALLGTVDGLRVLVLSVERWRRATVVHLGVEDGATARGLVDAHGHAVEAWAADPDRRSERFPVGPGEALVRRLGLGLIDSAGSVHPARLASAGGTGTEWDSTWLTEPAVHDLRALQLVADGLDAAKAVVVDPGCRLARAEHPGRPTVSCPGAVLGRFDRAAVALLSVELWPDRVVLQLAAEELPPSLDPVRHPRVRTAEHADLMPPDAESLGTPAALVLELRDDVGTRYTPRAAQAGCGPDAPWSSRWSFEPAAPTAARFLTVTLHGLTDPTRAVVPINHP